MAGWSGDLVDLFKASAADAGSDAAAMRTRAKRDGDDWILNGSNCWITNGGKSTWYTVMAVTDPDKGADGISSFMVRKDDEGLTVDLRNAISASRARPPPSCTSRTAASRPTGSSANRAPASRPRWRPSITPARQSAPRRWA